MEDAREARRKRLAERRTDRLAFITGQSRSLEQSAPHPTVASGGDTAALGTLKQSPSEDIRSNVLQSTHMQETALRPETSRLCEHEVECENSQGIRNDVLREWKNKAASSEHDANKIGEEISGGPFITSMLQQQAGHDGYRAAISVPSMRFSVFTPREISQSVLVTENIRLLVAFSVALLVILSDKGILVGGGIMSSIISFRPLFLVLLTNVTIILGWIFLNQGNNQRHDKDARKAEQGGEGWPNDLSRILEIGQVLYKVLGAAFMDCSICAVIMICGIVV